MPRESIKYQQEELFKSPNNLGSRGKLNVSTLLNQLNFKYKNKSNINSFSGSDIIRIYS